jgi:alkanesulfonate monooxygenase SsuD/methylene tetrahydromethanopterin reductase-like flavin-dependent oxidoreductase (luciferase family)
MYLMTAFGGVEARERMDAEFVDWNFRPEQCVAAVGSVEQVADEVRAFRDAGATTVVLQPTAGEPDLEGFLAQVGEVGRLL